MGTAAMDSFVFLLLATLSMHCGPRVGPIPSNQIAGELIWTVEPFDFADRGTLEECHVEGLPNPEAEQRVVETLSHTHSSPAMRLSHSSLPEMSDALDILQAQPPTRGVDVGLINLGDSGGYVVIQTVEPGTIGFCLTVSSASGHAVVHSRVVLRIIAQSDSRRALGRTIAAARATGAVPRVPSA